MDRRINLGKYRPGETQLKFEVKCSNKEVADIFKNVMKDNPFSFFERTTISNGNNTGNEIVISPDMRETIFGKPIVDVRYESDEQISNEQK